MSLASIIFYGDGFQKGQDDAKKKYFNFKAANPEPKEKKLDIEVSTAYADGYCDGHQFFKEGIVL